MDYQSVSIYPTVVLQEELSKLKRLNNALIKLNPRQKEVVKKKLMKYGGLNFQSARHLYWRGTTKPVKF